MSLATDALKLTRRRSSYWTAPDLESGDFPWRVLNILNGFRLMVGALLVAGFFLSADPRLVGAAHPPLFLACLAGWLAFGIINTLLIRHRWPSMLGQVYTQVGVDILAVTALMHAGGGIGSGIGGLLVVSIGAASLLVPGRVGFLFAALATMALLGEQTVSSLRGITDNAEYASAGILGAVIFVITLAVQQLSRRVQESEDLARQRGVDLANLAELNDYIIQRLRESIVVVDGDNRIRLINSSAAAHLGVADTRPGLRVEDVAPALHQQLGRWRLSGVRPNDRPLTITAADGSTLINLSFAPLGDDSDSGMLIFMEDAGLLAERVQQSKLAALGRLSASIAHEIRNPIGAMSHAGQLLAESPAIGVEERRLTDIIRTNSDRVSNIVESVLALSRRDSTRAERLALCPWLNDFCAEFTRTLQLQEGAVTVLPGPSDIQSDIQVLIDPTHLHQVLWNLCDNAVKYASETAGAIAVELSYGRLHQSGRPFLEIADRGPGIRLDKVDEVFEPFYTGKHGGTGLGLFISRELCECNGATLRYEPRAGGGSIFRVVFSDPDRWRTN
jgi:two-component system sensor histidine kinase PilS (NtrC family)